MMSFVVHHHVVKITMIYAHIIPAVYVCHPCSHQLAIYHVPGESFRTHGITCGEYAHIGGTLSPMEYLPDNED